jgi:chromosome segregation ATPase
MKAFFASMFNQQSPPPGSNEGLPYWTFWLLLFAILLLVVFIFLRDKDLRRRLNLFFFGAKKKLIKIRLQARLRRESRRKSDVLRNLGKKIWEEGIELPRGEKISQELARLQQHIDELGQETKEVQSKITDLETDLQKFTQKHEELIREQISARNPYQQKLTDIMNEERLLEIEITRKQKELEALVRGLNTLMDETHLGGESLGRAETSGQSQQNESKSKTEEMIKQRKETDELIKQLVDKRLDLEKERKDHQEKIDEMDAKIVKIEEGGKKRTKEFHKEIREWRKNKEKLLERIEHNEKKKIPLFERFGEKADESRVSQNSLSLFYSQIDRSNERIQELEEQIKNL